MVGCGALTWGANGVSFRFPKFFISILICQNNGTGLKIYIRCYLLFKCKLKFRLFLVEDYFALDRIGSALDRSEIQIKYYLIFESNLNSNHFWQNQVIFSHIGSDYFVSNWIRYTSNLNVIVIPTCDYFLLVGIEFH